MKFIAFLLFLLFVGVENVRSQPLSPYFPNTGKGAVLQNINELKNPSVILMIALAPGFEDRATIAYYRIARGPTVAVAYVTNGEDIPSDLNGEMFYQLASRRKEEAYQALSLLGTQAFFLNIPVNDFPACDSGWHFLPSLNAALNDKLDTLMSVVQPDVVVLNSDPFSPGGKSKRLAYLQQILAGFTRRHKTTIRRIFVETNESQQAVKIPVEQKNTLWRRTYLQIAGEAAAHYTSLRFQIPLWENGRLHYYRQLYPAAVKEPVSLDAGLPELGPELKTLFTSIRSSFAVGRERPLAKILKILEAGIRDVDASIGLYGHTLNTSNLRVLATWKSGLENLRCAALGVDIPYTVSDTVVTPVQLFFFRVEHLSPWMKKGKTQIVFPGVVEKKWVVNEKRDPFYALSDTQAFRVLSPRQIPLTSAETPQGFSSLQSRASFSFIIVHQDKNSLRNFMYRRDIPLIIAPYRSVEVLTPQIASYRDSAVVVRLRSNVRDRSGGEMFISDALVASPKVKVSLPGKNYVVTDTLSLRWKDTLIAQNREVALMAGGNLAIGSFVCRSLDVQSSPRARIGLYSAINNSPLSSALRRIGVSPSKLETEQFTGNNLSKFSAVIIDQFSARSLFSSRDTSALLDWVKSGRKLIILPQYGAGAENSLLNGIIHFSYLPFIGYNEPVKVDSAEHLFEEPNKISGNDLRGAWFPLSFGGLHGTFDNSMQVLMESADNRMPLVVQRKIGKGTVLYCALNLFPRLLSLDEASYRLLANMVAQ
ncbi:MAG: PIG-L family deacetylase [Bacteroidota bacterium]|nr:PIG-L family deacetylase [Bacteroidota bacterium]